MAGSKPLLFPTRTIPARTSPLLLHRQISLPKGGGAISGIGEKFAANPVTGTGSMTVPLFTSPGRSGFGPQLSLSYDSAPATVRSASVGRLSVPSITRRTDKGLPKYRDAEESDIFILSGAEDLVPSLEGDGRVEREPSIRLRADPATACSATGRGSKGCSPASSGGPTDDRHQPLALDLERQHHDALRQARRRADRRPGRSDPHLHMADLRKLRRQGQCASSTSTSRKTTPDIDASGALGQSEIA